MASTTERLISKISSLINKKMFINDISKRFSQLISNVYSMQINGENKTVYQLMVINKTDLELLHSTIQRLKLSFPHALITLSIVDSIVTDTVKTYLEVQNLRNVGSYQQDFGVGGKSNTYWRYNNFSPQLDVDEVVP